MPFTKDIQDYLNKVIGIKPSEVKPTTIDIFDIEKAGTYEKELPFSTQSTLSPTSETPVGTSRIKETGIKTGKTGKTFLGLAETGSKEIQNLGKQIAEPGSIIPPEDATVELEQKIQESRPRIEKDLPAGTVFTEVKPGESFESYFEKVKKDFPNPASMEALKKEAAKQYAIKFPEYKQLAKNPDLLEAILSEKNINPEEYVGGTYEKGMKVKSSTTSGMRGFTTEALEQAGYITKSDTKAIDSAIEELIDNYPQDIEKQFQVNPDTGKPYTKTQMKSAIKTRFLFALSKYFNQEIKPEMVKEVMEKMRGSFSSVNAEAVAENIYKKVRPKYMKPFLASFLGIIKSGGASELLRSGTGAMLGVPLELAFPSEAEAAEYFTPEELGQMRIKQKFGIDSL